MEHPRQIFKNTAILALSSLIERASSVFLYFFVSRTLGVHGLGVYSVAMALYALIARWQEMGSTSLLVREIAKDRSKTHRYVAHLSIMGTGVGVVIIALSSIVLPHLGYSAEVVSSMHVVILAVIPGALNALQEAVFVAHQRVEFQTYTTFVAAMVNIGVSICLLMRGYGIVSLMVAFVVTKYLVTICYYFLISRYITALHWEFRWSFALTLIQEMKAFTGLSILQGLFGRPEIIILSLVRNEAQVGFYGAALKLVDLWYLVPQIYMTNVFPVLSRFHHLADKKFQVIQDQSIKYLLAMSLPLAVGLMVAAEPIVKLLYGPGFEPSIGALRILAWNLPLNCLNAVFWRVLAARDQQRSVLRVQLITTVTRLAGGYALISMCGYLGAAITAVASLLFHNRLLSLYIKRNGTQLRVLSLGWRFALVALVMGALILAFGHHLHLWILIPLAAAIYATLIVLVKAFSPDDLAVFRKIIIVKTVRVES